MSNMSYCRFENTDSDLGDCQDALEVLLRGEGDPLSPRELEAAQSLVRRCLDVAMLLAERAELEVDDLNDKRRLADAVLVRANDECVAAGEEDPD